MFRLTLIIILLVTLNRQVVVSQSENEYYFIHPTFDHAAELPLENRTTLLYEVVKTEGASIRPMDRRMLEYRYLPGYRNYDKYEPLASAETIFKFNLTRKVIRTMYKYEQEHVKKTFLDKTKYLDGDIRRSCHTYTFRAFDIFTKMKQGDDPEKLFAIGIDQGHGSCLIEYKDVDLTTETVLDEEKIYRSYMISDLPKTNYKISSIRVSSAPSKQSSLAFKVDLLDEAGYFYETLVDINKERFNPASETQSFSSVKLDDVRSAEKFSNKKIEGEIKQAANNGQGLEIMKKHFKYGFIEAITLYNDCLVYSRGMFLVDGKLLNSIQAGQTPMPRLFHEKITNAVVLALEMYTFKGKHIVHMGTVKTGAGGGGKKVKEYSPNYHYCQVKDLKLLEGLDWNKAFEQDKDNYCKIGRFVPFLMPIDIVYMESCKKTVLFYPHAYQMFEPDVPMNLRDKQPPFKIVKWMIRPANAFLFHRNRLYMFSSGNELWISKELSGCSLDSFEWESLNTTQSQLLMKFEESIKGPKSSTTLGSAISDQAPNYYSRRHKLNGAWDPPLKETYPLKAGLELKKRYIPDPGTTTTTTTRGSNDSTTTPEPTTTPIPTPDPELSNFSIIIVAGIVVVIIVIILCSIYCFCFKSDTARTGSDTKSGARKQATAPTSQPVAGSAQVDEEQSDNNLASELTTASSVRSSFGKSEMVTRSALTLQPEKAATTAATAKTVTKAPTDSTTYKPSSKLAGAKSPKAKSPTVKSPIAKLPVAKLPAGGKQPVAKSSFGKAHVSKTAAAKSPVSKSARSPQSTKSIRSPGARPTRMSKSVPKSPGFARPTRKSPIANRLSALAKIKTVSVSKQSPSGQQQSSPSNKQLKQLKIISSAKNSK